MARLFIKHKPTAIAAVRGLSQGTFSIRVNDLVAAGIEVKTDSLDVVYLCVVEDGKCWAGRSFYIHASRTLVRLTCSNFSNTELGQQMILADMILN